ncbi:MAG: hypothetical protein J6031_00335 [Bacteroidales bacterium]|nr:hypothetical protein [Bacteroidales bacterium]
MDKVSKTLTQHLARVTELASRLENSGGKTARIDVDMLLEALREMYDAVYGWEADKPDNGEGDEAANSCETLESENEAVTVQAEEPAVPAALMVDNEAEVVYAIEPEEVAVEEAAEQPTMEEIEGQPNDELFEETVETASEERQTENEEEGTETEEHPKTLWDKLQESQSTTTVAERIEAAKIISDLLEEKAKKTDNEDVKTENEENQEPVSEPTPEPTLEPTPEPVQQQAQPSLFDYFKTTQPERPAQRTLADSLGSIHGTQELKSTTNKVSDLRTVININDKFSFMNELFHNNMKGYNDFILRLNAISDREEALEYVATIAEQYNWDNESLAVKTFFSIFDRKF